MPEKDAIRKVAEEIDGLYNPVKNAELCRDGKKRLKAIEQVIRAEVDAERDRIVKIVQCVRDDTYYHVVNVWAQDVVSQIEKGGA